MRELYFGLYRKLPYKYLIYIILAEYIYKGEGWFQGNKLNIKKNILIKKSERKILEKINLSNKCKLFPSDLENWLGEIKNEFINNNYLREYFILGYKYTNYFRHNLKMCIKNEFNYDIIEFIKSQEIKYLKPIISNIEDINIPEIGKDFKNANMFIMDKFEWNNKNMAIRGNTLYLKKLKI
jgi:hypothetical protein